MASSMKSMAFDHSAVFFASSESTAVVSFMGGPDDMLGNVPGLQGKARKDYVRI
jgi:hypothetical protein